jgi:Na+/H+ antiporter NhaC
LILAAIVAGLVGHKNGHSFERIGKAAVDGVSTATVTSPLVPWNSCGAYMSSTLGIATIAYLPFTFFNLINPILSFSYALLGFQIKHIEPGEVEPGMAYKETPEEARYHGVEGQRTHCP